MEKDIQYLEFLVNKLNSINFYLNDVYQYNITINNYRYYVNKFKVRYKGVEYPTPNKDMMKLISKVGKPYLGKSKIKIKSFTWRNISWN